LIIGEFIDNIQNELQFEDIEFANRIKRELLPNGHRTLLSVIPGLRNYTSHLIPIKNYDNTNNNYFLSPSNLHTVDEIKSKGQIILPYGTINKDSYFQVIANSYLMKHYKPLRISNLYNMFLPVVRTLDTNSIKYTIQYFLYTDFLNGTPFDMCWEDAGYIYDNENRFKIEKEIPYNTIVRLKKDINTLYEKGDSLYFITDWGEYVISIDDDYPIVYLAEDGSLYRELDTNLELSNLIKRNSIAKRLSLIKVNNLTQANVEIDLTYSGWAFPFYSDNDDDFLLNEYYNYLRLYILVEGAKYFKMNQDYNIYMNEFQGVLQNLRREYNIRKNNKGNFKAHRNRRILGRI